MDNSFNTSWINNDKEYADIISFYDRNMSRSNLLSFIKTNILEKVSHTFAVQEIAKYFYSLKSRYFEAKNAGARTSENHFARHTNHSYADFKQ